MNDDNEIQRVVDVMLQIKDEVPPSQAMTLAEAFERSAQFLRVGVLNGPPSTHPLVGLTHYEQAAAELRRQHAKIEALKAAEAVDARDAERYRKWREDYTSPLDAGTDMLIELADAWTPDQVDAAIDAAMASQGKEANHGPAL